MIMAHYTTTIKTLIDTNFDFGLKDYPIFDENYRNILNNKILNHYYESEIGFETPALFKFYLNNKLNEIMDYYNTLYVKQKSLIENIFDNVNIKETFEGNATNETNTSSESNSTSNSDSESNNRELYQLTPQGQIKMQDLDSDEVYATNYTKNKNNSNSNIEDNSSSSGNSSSTNTNDYIKSLIGRNGGKYNVELLNDLKNNLLNIDMMVIDELYDLFMQIF